MFDALCAVELCEWTSAYSNSCTARTETTVTKASVQVSSLRKACSLKNFPKQGLRI